MTIESIPVGRGGAAAPPAGVAADDEYLWQYARELMSELSETDPQRRAAEPEVWQRATRVASSARGELTWEDLYELECHLLRLSTAEQLRAKLPFLRREYEKVAGPDRYTAYMASVPKPDAATPEPQMRADAEQLLREIHWLYAAVPTQELLRADLLKWTLVLSSVFLGGTLLAGSIVVYSEGLRNRLSIPDIPTLPLVMVAGGIGGLTSTVRRIQSTPLQESAVLDFIQTGRSGLSVYVSPFFGVVFAIVLYMLFAGKFVQGTVFPDITVPSLAGAAEGAGGPGRPGAAAKETPAPAATRTAEGRGIERPVAPEPGVSVTGAKPVPRGVAFLLGVGPKEGVDYAKLLIWCFIAGFAEQFVPDRLQRLTSAQNDAAKAAGLPAA